MSSITCTFILPEELATMGKQITNINTEPGTESILTTNNAGQQRAMDWNSLPVLLGEEIKTVSLVNPNPRSALPFSTEFKVNVPLGKITSADNFSLFSVSTEPYLNDANNPVQKKEFKFTTAQVFEAIRDHVALQEQALWVGGRTQVTEVALSVLYNPEKPYERNLDGFTTNIVVSSEALGITGMACNALRCRGFRSQEQLEFNAHFMPPMQPQQRNEKRD